MAGTMRKMMEYLSFAEPQDEVYEDEVAGYDEQPSGSTAVGADDRRGSYRTERVSVAAPVREEYDEPADRLERTERLERIVDDHRAEVTPINSHNAHLGHELRRIVTVHPSTYNEARTIGEAFRDGTPVIMNLSGMGESDAKRMVDFAAGLVFGLHGAIERVTSRVFLLSPATVEVESEAPEPDASGRFFNQS